MNLPWFSLAALVLVSACALQLLLGRNWRRLLLALALQYLGVWLATATTLSPGLALVKLLAGWAAAGVLWAGMAGQALPEVESVAAIGRIFRLLGAGIVAAAVYALAPAVQSWLPAPDDFSLLAGLTLIGLGLLQLGLTTQVLRVILGLLTALAGFEIIYALVENSLLVLGLLAALTLGLSLTGAYLLAAPQMEESG